MSWQFTQMLALAAKPERIVVGLISGTSADAIATAVCRIHGDGIPSSQRAGARVHLLHYHDHPYDPNIRRMVQRAGALTVRDVAELHVHIGALFADACLNAVRAAAIAIDEVDVIGSHGQTLYHHSSVAGAPRAGFQAGDGDQIAERTGRPVISDFRARDIAAGGEGAPLTPFSDLILFASSEGVADRRVILNLGGIANVTILDADPQRVIGFDTGPANALIDRLAGRLSAGTLACDVDGRIARSGRVNETLLGDLLRTDLFLAQPPPKSTGFEMYGDAFLDRALAMHGRLDADLMATLTEFTARTIALAVGPFVTDPRAVEIVIAGGGVRNPALVERIAANVAPVPVRSADELGVPACAREAMGFAVLANEALFGHPTALPRVTGARHPTVLGKWSFPSAPAR